MNKAKATISFKIFFMLQAVLLLYASASLLSKYASGYPFLSLPFCGLYIGVVIALLVYALLWQQMLKRIDLNIAYANKAITVIWGIVFGKMFFAEDITWNMVLGSFVIILGVILVVKNNE